MKSHVKTALLFLFVSVATSALHAQTAGKPDVSFGVGGVAKITTVTSGEVSEVIALPDGKVLGAGDCQSQFGSGMCLYRFTNAGAPDTSFGIDGVSFVIPGGIGSAKSKIAVRPDGRIVVARLSQVAQVNPNGLGFDPTFNGGAAITLNPPAAPGYNLFNVDVLALLPNGKFLIGGNCFAQQPSPIGGSPCVVQINESGQIDPTFGDPSHNWLLLSATPRTQIDNNVQTITPLPDARFLVTFVCPAAQINGVNNYSVCARRVLANGTAQHTYILDTSTSALWESVKDVRVVGDYAMFTGNSYSPTDGKTRTFALRRQVYQVPGLVDDQFGGAFPTDGYAASLNLEVAGTNGFDINARVFSEGGSLYVGVCEATANLCMLRLNAAGTLDSAFGNNGRYAYVDLELKLPNSNRIGLAETRDGKIIVGGACYNPTSLPCVARLNGIVQAAPVCTMDVDGDGRILPTTDGLILTRVALGLNGNAAIAGAIAPTATRTSWAAIYTYLADQCRMPITP